MGKYNELMLWIKANTLSKQNWSSVYLPIYSCNIRRLLINGWQRCHTIAFIICIMKFLLMFFILKEFLWTWYHLKSHNPQNPAILHDLLLHVVASTPQSSSVKHLKSLRASGMWQALSICWPDFKFKAGHTCRDIELIRLTLGCLCTVR